MSRFAITTLLFILVFGASAPVLANHGTGFHTLDERCKYVALNAAAYKVILDQSGQEAVVDAHQRNLTNTRQYPELVGAINAAAMLYRTRTHLPYGTIQQQAYTQCMEGRF